MAKPIQLLVNSAKLLDTVAEAGPQSPAELADSLGVPRPSVYRLIDALSHVGLVTVLDDGRAQLGLEVLHLAHAAFEQIPEAQAARPELERLNEVTGQTVYVCAPRGPRVACLDWVRGKRVSLLLLRPGATLPVHAGAASRASAAFAPQLVELLAPGDLEVFTPHTIQSLEALRSDGEEVRERGYSISDEDVTEGIAALGVPFFAPDGTLRGTLSLAGLRAEVRGQEAEYVRELGASARRVEAVLAAMG